MVPSPGGNGLRDVYDVHDTFTKNATTRTEPIWHAKQLPGVKGNASHEMIALSELLPGMHYDLLKEAHAKGEPLRLIQPIKMKRGAASYSSGEWQVDTEATRKLCNLPAVKPTNTTAADAPGFLSRMGNTIQENKVAFAVGAVITLGAIVYGMHRHHLNKKRQDAERSGHGTGIEAAR